MIKRNVKLIVAMAKSGVNSSDLAEKSGVSRTTINLIRNGKTTGSVETLKKLAIVLNVEIGEIIE